MNANTKSNPTKTCETIKLGIDAHAKWYYVGRQVDGATPQPVLQNLRASAAARKKAVVAVGRQLAVDLWRLFTDQTTAEKLRLTYLPEAA